VIKASIQQVLTIGPNVTRIVLGLIINTFDVERNPAIEIELVRKYKMAVAIIPQTSTIMPFLNHLTDVHQNRFDFEDVSIKHINDVGLI